MATIKWRLGFEVELLAPPGKSRLDYARALSERLSGSVVPFFHVESEPSALPGQAIFHNLTLAFQVLDKDGLWVASVMDDLTLQADLKREMQPRQGWYRILSDDKRILHLIQAQCDARRSVGEVLEPLAELFQTELVPGPRGMVKVNDKEGTSVAIATPLPGERERPCEIVTAPLGERQEETLEELLRLARELEFLIPTEGATHIHFDGRAFRSAAAFSRLVRLFHREGERLKSELGVNPHCRRLGAWPPELLELVNSPDFQNLSWAQAQAHLVRLNLTKYCDFNLRNLLRDDDFCTFEVRVLPAHLQAAPICRGVTLLEDLLKGAATVL